MKIAIHHSEISFSERWITYCNKNGIDYKLVNCYNSDIISQIYDCDGFMWHFHHKNPKDSKFAKQLIFSIQTSGKKVFPDFNTSWHFDDKVGQKYLLEALNAPLVKSYSFYSRKEALDWVKHTTFPKVFKLRNGAGSDNVRLIRSKRTAERLIRIAFNKGFKQYEGWKNLKERIRIYKHRKGTLLNVIKGMVRLIYTTEYARVSGREKGYIYFQDFIPENEYDIRVIVIGDKAFAIKRMVRGNDFRASGSGYILYEKNNFDEETIRIAFDLSEKLNVQCMGYDFIYNNGIPFIVEISYGFTKEAYDSCEGYWDRNLNWYEGAFNPYGWMVENLINDIQK